MRACKGGTSEALPHREKRFMTLLSTGGETLYSIYRIPIEMNLPNLGSVCAKCSGLLNCDICCYSFTYTSVMGTSSVKTCHVANCIVATLTWQSRKQMHPGKQMHQLAHIELKFGKTIYIQVLYAFYQ
jgi:hypothetical protein